MEKIDRDIKILSDIKILNLNRYIMYIIKLGSYIIRIKSVPIVILIVTNEILNYTYICVNKKKRETDFKLIKFDRTDINLK